MVEGILGKKVGMSQIFDEAGQVVPVTVVEAGPCYVTQVKTNANDGYEAVQLGFGAIKRLNKPGRGHLKNLPALRHLREVKATDPGSVKVGQKIDASMFHPGDLVDVIAISKGKGFAGVVKRHGFSGGFKTHGQSDRHRAPGSIGAGTSPGKIWKDMRMAGHMGRERVTVQNLKVVQVHPERNVLVLRGAIPGPAGGLLTVRRAVKAGK